MKKIFFVFMVIFCFFLTSCDEVDNYDAPDGGIYGTIYDAETNDTVPLPVQGSSGTIINLYELNTSATTSVDFYAKYNGTYENSQVFNCDYRVIINGPFVETAEDTVSVNGQTRLDFKVTPYARISASASASGQTVTITYDVSRTNDDYTVSEVYGYWNFSPGIDNSANNYAEKVTVNETSGTIVFDLENSETFQDYLYKIAENGNRVYFRIGAKTEGVINYSKQVMVTLD